MGLFESLKLSRRDVGIADIYPITHLNSPTVFESKEGMLGSTIKVKGVPFLTAENDVLNHFSSILHRAILSLNEDFLVYVTTHRKKKNISLKGDFTSGFSKRVDKKYHARFEGRNMYVNNIYITIVLKKKGKERRSLFEKIEFVRMSNFIKLKEMGGKRKENTQKLKNKIDELLTFLSSFEPKLLGDKDEKESELIAFLSLFINGGNSLPINHTEHFPRISSAIQSSWSDEVRYGHGLLGQYISNKSIYFGEYIQFQGAALRDTKYAVILSLKKYPLSSNCLSLDPLLKIDCEYLQTHTFFPEEKGNGLKIIESRRAKLISSEFKGGSQLASLSTLEDNVATESVTVGYHHNSLMLIADNVDELENQINETQKAYSLSGATLIRETLGLEAAFWSMIPCLQKAIVRSALITSKNFVDFCPLHNYETGFRNENFLGEAITLLETPSKTPVYLNLHQKGTKTNPSNGMTFVLGGSDAGKSTLVNFISLQMNRYKGRTFYIERDGASRICVLADEGRYLEIAPEKSNQFQINPLQLENTKENVAFIKDWFSYLLLREGEEEVNSAIKEVVNDCIDYAFECLKKEHRTLSNVAKLLPKDFDRWPEVKRWIKGSAASIDGEFSWIFDNQKDLLTFDCDKFGIDATYLMDKVSTNISTPIYMYLLYRMRQSMDGQKLTTIIMDEAWQVLNSSYWIKALKEWVPTIRKDKGHFIFMTQSPKSIVESNISHVLIDNNATMILLPNRRATEDVYINRLGLNVEELDIVKTIPVESRLFLYKQDSSSILCKLDLSCLADEIRIFSANKESNNLLNKIIKEVGEEPDSWIPVFIERSKK